jgi:hypothetical protein
MLESVTPGSAQLSVEMTMAPMAASRFRTCMVSLLPCFNRLILTVIHGERERGKAWIPLNSGMLR